MLVPHGRGGQVWGRFRVTESVGRGSFGRVFKVIDAETGEARALRVVPRGSGEAMLLDELEQLARLRHPSLPRVFEVGRTQQPIDELPAGSPFFLAEWIAGGRCDARAWGGADLGARVWSLLGEVAGALATVHAAGLVHGDVAPQNILLAEDGHAVLVDLGLGAAIGARGTPAYMAPEALAGDAEPRSDLYGLGATTVRLVTGRPPFDGAGLGDLVQRVVAGGPPPALPALPRPLADLVARLLARDPDARPPSALAVLDELDQLAAAIAPGTPRRARPKVGPAPAPIAWPGAAAVIHAIARSLAGTAAAIVVVGPPASGARELVDGAIRRHQLAQLARGPRTAAAPSADADDATERAPGDLAGDRIADRTAHRTSDPVRAPIGDPSGAPMRAPTGDPMRAPTGDPSGAPVRAPTGDPSGAPVRAPTGDPMRAPTGDRTRAPMRAPAGDPGGDPTGDRGMSGVRPRPAPRIAGTLDEVGAALAVPASDPGSSARGWIERVARAARRAGAPVVIEIGDDPRAAALIGALARADGGNPVIAIADRDPGAARPGVVVHAAPILDGDGVVALATAMLGTAPPRAWAHALHVASSGLALAVIELVRSIAGEPHPFAVDWTARTTAGIAELRTKQLRAAPSGARRIAAAVAAWGGRARIDRVLATLRGDGKAAAVLADVAELERLGLAHRRGDEVAIDRATIDAAEAIAGADGLARLAAAALAGPGQLDARDAPGSGDDRLARDVDARDARVRDASSRDAGPRDAGARADGLREERSSRDGLADRGARLQLIAPLLERAELDAGRAELACEAAEHLLARGRPDRALALARRAIAIDPARAGLVAARAATAAHAYREAADHARTAEAAGADPVRARLVSARAAQRAGELDAAEAALAALHAAHPAHAEVAGAYARLLVTRSRYREARAIAIASGPLAGLRAEAAGLAAFYLGELEAADAAFAALEVGAAATGDAASVGRASSLRGMVAQQRGQLGLASDRYREAARRLGEVGELHAAATAELDLGTVLAERGRASEALPRLTAAGRVFSELGATTESCAAELNRGNALLLLGQLDDARVAAELAIARADGAPHLRAFALIVAGDAHRRLGDEAVAVRNYREALAIAAQRGDAHAQLSAHIALAEAGQRDCDAVTVEALCASDDDRDRWMLARGRLALRDPASVVRSTGSLGDATAAVRDPASVARSTGSLGDATAAVRDSTSVARSTGSLGDATAALARACAAVAVRAGEADRLERAFRGHAIAAQLAHRARETGLARSEAERARVAHAAWTAATAPAFRAALDGDPDLARLPGEPAERPVRAPRDEAEAVPLRRLLTLSRRLNTEASVERILDDVIDTAIELTCAERGFLLLRQPTGELAAVVSRNFHAEDLEPVAGAAASDGATRTAGDDLRDADEAGGGRHARSVSRSIAERAAQTGEPVLTVDPGIDERLGSAARVAALRLRSVLAVPLRQRGAVTGCIYVDHRLRRGAFDAGSAIVLGELADIAAIAIENARLTGDLRRTTREIDALNARLSSELAERDAELVRVKAELPDRDRLRHRYERIVGRAPAVVKMLDLVDRAAATALPVVIVGESGTGKELVARALHDHGPRKDAAFVAINCGAVPEQLLESELFGHARGSFTGADRDHRGLFEVADGGTLFLDEVADTSLGMQAKLLRVLQDGTIRRVGDTQVRRVDVRVIAASQHPLATLSAAGRFREDLRFRLDVITIPVPPLRDRDGDVPLLVEHLLARLSAGRTMPRLTRAALRALAQHRWPGNVRELENALARGLALGGEVIDVADLPEAIAHATARPEPARPTVGEDLRLRPAQTATEQAYIAAAMTRAKGNQTVAARLLGLSRFGLQKKLRRLTTPGDDDDSA